MRRTIYLIALFGLLFSCKNSEKVEVQDKAPVLYSVLGELTQTSQYCGGARPTQEMEDEIRRPRPYPLKIYLRKDSVNRLGSPVIKEIMPDAEGKLELKLEAGTYCIVREYQLQAANPSSLRSQDVGVDEACFRKKWAECFKSFEVKDASVDLGALNIKHRCFLPDLPCVRFEGQMPP